MYRANRLSFLKGQSYNSIDFIAAKEMTNLGIPMVFGVNTICFRADGKWKFAHVNNLNVIQLTSVPIKNANSIPFTKIVTSDDSIYGPGTIILKGEYEGVGIPDIFEISSWCSPVVFTTSVGTFMMPDVNITLLELDEIHPHAPTPKCKSTSKLCDLSA